MREWGMAKGMWLGQSQSKRAQGHKGHGRWGAPKGTRMWGLLGLTLSLRTEWLASWRRPVVARQCGAIPPGRGWLSEHVSCVSCFTCVSHYICEAILGLLWLAIQQRFKLPFLSVGSFPTNGYIFQPDISSTLPLWCQVEAWVRCKEVLVSETWTGMWMSASGLDH